MKSYGFFPDLCGLIKPDPLKQLPRWSNIQSNWDKALQTIAKISASSLDPHDSALYQQEVVWKEQRPNSQILFINVCFHLKKGMYNYVQHKINKCKKKEKEKSYKENITYQHV